MSAEHTLQTADVLFLEELRWKYRGVFSKAVRTWSQLVGFVFTNQARTARRSEVYGLLQVGGASFWCILVRRSCNFALWRRPSICNSPRYFFNALQARNRGLLRLGRVTDEVENTSFCYRFSPFAKKRKAACSVCGYLHSVGFFFKLPTHLLELRFLRFQQGARHRAKMGRCIQIVGKNLAPLGFLHPPAFSKLLGRSICENRAAFHALATEYGWLAHLFVHRKLPRNRRRRCLSNLRQCRLCKRIVFYSSRALRASSAFENCRTILSEAIGPVAETSSVTIRNKPQIQSA